ncbi:MAG: hypothetical protein WDO69_25825 [Pseudomonadota bacterium]
MRSLKGGLSGVPPVLSFIAHSVSSVPLLLCHVLDQLEEHASANREDNRVGDDHQNLKSAFLGGLRLLSQAEEAEHGSFTDAATLLRTALHAKRR